jgi:hypothetical protein
MSEEEETKEEAMKFSHHLGRPTPFEEAPIFICFMVGKRKFFPVHYYV